MSRTGAVPRLMGQFAEPFCEVHPEDARILGVTAAGLVTVSAPEGTAVLRALVTDRQPRGSVFVPMHWTGRFAAAGRVNALVRDITDPVSGQPALKGATVTIRAFAPKWYGFAVSAARPETIEASYWALSPAEGGYRVELAGTEGPADWQAFAARLFGADAAEWVGVQDAGVGAVRLAAFAGERCLGALFVAPTPVGLSRGYVAEALTARFGGADRLRLLAGRGGADRPDDGALICACNAVGINRIIAAIRGGATNVGAVGEVCGAGTGCGSCRTDIRRLIDIQRLETAV